LQVMVIDTFLFFPGRKPCSNNSMCIRESWICDGDDDCGDNSDESESRCSNTTCDVKEMKCASTGRCIPIRWRCDGDDDCGDRSDEGGNCTTAPKITCKQQEFTCKNGMWKLLHYSVPCRSVLHYSLPTHYCTVLYCAPYLQQYHRILHRIPSPLFFA
jgi:hypothetical protein